MREKINHLDEQRPYYLAFSHFRRIGPMGIRRLERYFIDMKHAFFANIKDLESAGIRPSVAADFIGWRNSPAASINDMLSDLDKEQIGFMTWHDADYPALLKETASPPPVIYYKGRVDDSHARRLAVVGSRESDAYGQLAISGLLPPVIAAGITIVSGLALGIDTLAHQKALNLGGTTWAIIGSGLDKKSVYPPANRRLAAAIIENGGALISEFPPGTPPSRQNFPQRNRLIAGMTQATLVVEAAVKSGALITARYALEENREVMAVPGNICSPLSAGTNCLISSGAKMVISPEDILESYGLDMNI